jgi:hypothetical protein
VAQLLRRAELQASLGHLLFMQRVGHIELGKMVQILLGHLRMDLVELLTTLMVWLKPHPALVALAHLVL